MPKEDMYSYFFIKKDDGSEEMFTVTEHAQKRVLERHRELYPKDTPANKPNFMIYKMLNKYQHSRYWYIITKDNKKMRCCICGKFRLIISQDNFVITVMIRKKFKPKKRKHKQIA